jgi:hypothetical protein
MAADERTEMAKEHSVSLIDCDIDLYDAFLAICDVLLCEQERIR